MKSTGAVNTGKRIRFLSVILPYFKLQILNE